FVGAVAAVDAHVAELGARLEHGHDLGGQLAQHRRAVADQLHADVLAHAAPAAALPAAAVHADLGAGRLRELLADRLRQRPDVGDAVLEGDHGPGVVAL